MDPLPSAPPPEERLPAWRRVLAIAAGSLMALVGGGVATMMLVLLGNAAASGMVSGRALLRGGLGTLLAVALLGVMAAAGVRWVLAGLRGRPSPRHPAHLRLDAWWRRHAFLGGLLAWGAVSLTTLIAARDPVALIAGRGSGLGQAAWWAFMAYLVLPLHVAAHEAGHAVAGALVGFRFTAVRVLGLTLSREGGRWRLLWAHPGATELLGLQAGVPEGPEGLRGRLALHALAGPAVTLGVAFACRAGALALGEPWALGTAILVLALDVAWWLGLALGLINLLPLRTRSGSATDGARLLASLRPDTPAAQALRRFQLSCAQGRRPRAWEAAAGDFLAVADQDPRLREALLLAALAVALDTGDRAQAGEILRRALERPATQPDVRHELELQAAMLEALEGRPAEAQARLGRLGPHPGHPDYPRLAAGVVSAAAGRLDEAAADLAAWEQALASTGLATTLRVGNEWALDALRARLDGRGERQSAARRSVASDPAAAL